jgi:hypothetical protein
MHQLHHLLDLFSFPRINEKTRSPAVKVLVEKEKLLFQFTALFQFAALDAGSSAIVATTVQHCRV